MKLRLPLRISVTACVVLLCAGMALYGYLSLRPTKENRVFNLYTLVSQDAAAVFETDCLTELMADIDELDCSRDGRFLYVSRLFAGLKKLLPAVADDSPHGLSSQMNRVLLSFHEPDTPLSQVLYCSLGQGDEKLLSKLVGQSVSETKYHGEEIRCYPLRDGNSLFAYVTDDFLVVSFRHELVEQVIDTRRKKRSLMETEEFRTMLEGRRRHIPATIYVHVRGVKMGQTADSLTTQWPLGGWAEFDMKFDGDAVYCSGISHADSTHTLFHALRMQQPVEGFTGRQLPASTFLCSRWAMSDVEALLGFLPGLDAEWLTYLKENAGGSAMTCLFLPEDTLKQRPCAVMSVPVKDESTMSPLPAAGGRSLLFPCTRCYRGNLLMAPDERSLAEYVNAMEDKRLLESDPAYERSIGSLSPTYNFLLMADMEPLLSQADAFLNLMPNFFVRHAKFFRHFLLAIQLTCTEGVVYPNIVLIYK